MPQFLRKIIRITARDSPNVRLALDEIAEGKTPSGREVCPGVLSWAEYQKRLALWDKIRICVGIDAQFYEGSEILLYPPTWLDRAERRAESLRGVPRKALACGVDPGEGGDKTAMSAVDELGLIEQVSRKTPDTSVITAEAIAFGTKHGVPPDMWVFDRGGGGKEHADRLRSQGYKGVRTVSFGEPVNPEMKRTRVAFPDRVDNFEERSAYVNRRAQMYHALRLLIDPALNEVGFAIPAEYTELRRQLAPIPLLYDPEGRIRLLPKHKRRPDSEEETLSSLLGCSPDELDSFVIAIWAMQNKPIRMKAGAMK
jgi:hypothetical protein